MALRLVLVAALIAAVVPSALAAPRTGGGPTTTRTVVSGLTNPWSLVFTPDGRSFVSERDTGRVLEVTDGQVRERYRLTAARDDLDVTGEGGLLGLAVPPSWSQSGQLYAYYTTSEDNRVVRFSPGGDAEPEPVLTGIPAGRAHNGGRIAFGPDGLLYVATGDAGQATLAQDRDSLAGKVLRITPEGAVPPGNPLVGSPVWTLGHRNVQGLAWDDTGRLFASEFGPNRDDEINQLVAGGNYGWPEVTGMAGDSRFVDPIFVRQPPEASWSGMTVLMGNRIPSSRGDAFVAALRGQRLWQLDLRRGEVRRSDELYVGEFGRLRDVVEAPDGSLWLVTGNNGDDRLIQIRHRGRGR